jgi:hypothetical protein
MLEPGGPGPPLAAQAPQFPLMLFLEGTGLPAIGWGEGTRPLQNFWARTAPAIELVSCWSVKAAASCSQLNLQLMVRKINELQQIIGV